MSEQELTDKIRRREIDINNQSKFFGILTRGLLVKLREDIKIRNLEVPHYIPHTGDDVLMLENKAKDVTSKPIVSNENYIYTIVPRCVVTPKNINLIQDQLTSPYAKGMMQYEDEEFIKTFNAEFRRMPITMTYDLEYLVDSYNDLLELSQQIITKLAVIRTYKIVYMGQTISCSYKIPDSLDGENNLDFEGYSTDDKRKKMTLSIEVESNIPIFNPETIIPSDKYIKKIYIHDNQIPEEEEIKKLSGNIIIKDIL